jgi:putative transposase
MQVFSTLLDWLWLMRKSEREKDLEILLLRRQLEIVMRQRAKPLRISRAENLTLAILASKLRSITRHPVNYFNAVIRIFQPETVFEWHRELVRRKCSYPRPKTGGRPRVAQEIERLLVRHLQHY